MTCTKSYAIILFVISIHLTNSLYNGRYIDQRHDLQINSMANTINNNGYSPKLTNGNQQNTRNIGYNGNSNKYQNNRPVSGLIRNPIGNGQAHGQISSGFVNSPITTSNLSSGTVVEVQLQAYSNPTLSLPHGKSCTCPQGKSCPFLKAGIPSCLFSFIIIISAPDQSVQYIASEFVPMTSGSVSSGNWTQLHVVNMTGKPMAIDVFVNHLGVVIDQATAQLENFNTLIHVDTFVIPLKMYMASSEGSPLNPVTQTKQGLLQGTTLQLMYSVSCTGGKKGSNCDLTCKPSRADKSHAVCTSTSGALSACRYDGSKVSMCELCPNGLNMNETGCLNFLVDMSTSKLVSSAYWIWTIVLACLLGITLLFLAFLVFLIARAENKKNVTNSSPYPMEPYLGTRSIQPLIQKEDEWNRGQTRVTSILNPNLRTPAAGDHEKSRTIDDGYNRTNGSSRRREAQV